MSKNLNEELTRIKTLFNFKVRDNSHDVLSEQNIKKSIITEQKVSLLGLVDEAKEKDSDVVKSTPGYVETMDWWGRGGPTKGKATQDKSISVKSLQYWNGDLTAKMGNPKSTYPIERIGNLTNEKNVKRLISNLNSISKKNDKLEKIDFNVATIVNAATQIQNELKKLSKNGNYIGADHENGGKYTVYGGSVDKYPTRLNILPFGPGNDDKYMGKVVRNLDVQFFNRWYKQLSNVGDILEKINNQAYWGKGEGKSFMNIKDEDKVGLLQGFTEKANKSEKRTISNALALKIGPKGAKWAESTEEIVLKLGSITDTGYPKNGVATQLFEDDSDVIRPDMLTGFNSWLNEQFDKVKHANGTVRKIGIQLFASTSAVPSTRFKDNGGNVALVNARADAMRVAVQNAVNAAGVDPSLIVFVTEAESGGSTLVPNNEDCLGWGDSEKKKFRNSAFRNKPENAAIKAEYEKEYAKCRYASFGLDLQYDTPEEKDEITKYKKVGNWKESISWHTPGGGRIPRGKLPKTKKYKGDPTSCPVWGDGPLIPKRIKNQAKGVRKKIKTPMGYM